MFSLGNKIISTRGFTNSDGEYISKDLIGIIGQSLDDLTIVFFEAIDLKVTLRHHELHAYFELVKSKLMPVPKTLEKWFKDTKVHLG